MLFSGEENWERRRTELKKKVKTDESLEEVGSKTLTSYVSKRLSRNPNLMKGQVFGKTKQQRSGVELAMDKILPGSAIRKPKILPQENVEVIPEADATDTVSMDVPLLLRMMEYAREDAKTDLDLHDVAEKMIELSKHHDYLCMDNYNEIVGSAAHDDVEESNAFTDARMNAIKAGKKSFSVGGKTYPVTGDISDELEAVEESCPHCGGLMYEASLMNEKKDACYYKVKSRYKVWPSAYASGALVKCRKAGAKNWGNKSKWATWI